MMAEFVMVVQPTKTEKEKRTKPDSPSLVIYCLGPFRAYQDDQPVTDWPSSKGKSIFKYLITHREHPVAKDILMELFWPGSSPDSARNNLNVAIYGLRQALRKVRPSFSHVLLS
ncbi:MAG: winged helix-turn-helix domain-containing protein [Anaerolineae bacterium]|nr:winged helix-turn-helix domain-containing protein [Anaerolineae bacterium]